MAQIVYCNRKETKNDHITISKFKGGINGRKVSCWFDLLFHLPDSVPSPLPAGQEGRGRSGQFGEKIPPSILLPSCPPLSQHYKAPCPLWLLTLMWARKRPRSRLARVCATGKRAPVLRSMCARMCAIDPDINPQPNRAVIVGLLYNNQWFPNSTNQRILDLLTSWCEWKRWHEGRRTSAQRCMFLHVCTGISTQEEVELIGQSDTDKYYLWDCGQPGLVFHYRGSELLAEQTQMALIAWHVLWPTCLKGNQSLWMWVHVH